MQPVKPWFKSKVVWVNTLTLAASILTIIATSELLAKYPELVVGITGIAIPIINVFLRWLTDGPITSVTTSMDMLRPGTRKK